MLNISLSVYGGFKDNHTTGMVAVDYEGAFDVVWRNGVVYKLLSIGIQGRLLHYVHSFLTDRKSRSLVNSITTDWVGTDVGIPQGSIIGPVLYLIFTSDISLQLRKHIKFADDLYL